ncbi:site-specific integrase (plasmid) [Streptomyces halstedii]|uniref:site-specific integrase n=1 Tax=Streptomyces halstedii TaxID=1944 RepID=UPI002F90896D
MMPGHEGGGDALDGITELVCQVERHLPVALVRETVARTVQGPVTRRRVEQELRRNPQVLATGRSPSMWSVGRLLVALKKAGAREVSAPVCCDCGKELRTPCSRRGGYWTCKTCERPNEVCAGCGRVRRVSKRDRHGQPLCQKCPDDGSDEGDLELVTKMDPALSADAVAKVLGQVAARPAVRRRLARTVLEQPDLLTGEGARAPEPVALHFLELLVAAGATKLVLPLCPRCGHQRPLAPMLDGVRVCQPCDKDARAKNCSRCGDRRPLAWRDEAGLLVCGACRSRDPVVRERCSGCGKQRPVAHRTDQGPLCNNCRPRRTGTCSLCGREKHVELSQVTGLPWCPPCAGRWMRCSRCSTVAPVRAGTRYHPICARCHNSDPTFWRSCGRCGTGWQISSAPCQRCQLDLHMHDLLVRPDSGIRPDLLSLRTALLGVERPDTALLWLREPEVETVIARMRDQTGPLVHGLLDELPQIPTLAHIRSVLVAAGTLPHRDELLGALEALAREAVDARTDSIERRILHGYAHWRLLRRLRQRVKPGESTTRQQYLNIRRLLAAAVAFLDWLSEQGRTMATCTQSDVDVYVPPKGIRPKETIAFLHWALAQGHASGIVPPRRVQHRVSGPFDEDKRWAVARRLLHDKGLRPADRVAGLVILLYAQQLSAVIRLKADQVTEDDGKLLLHLGPSPIRLASPLDQSMQELLATRRGRSLLGAPADSPWLFPGNRPGQHISESGMRKRLTKIGVRPGPSRNAALFALATEVPAAILSRKLGLSIDVAVSWQRLSAGDWMAYAATVSSRSSAKVRAVKANS